MVLTYTHIRSYHQITQKIKPHTHFLLKSLGIKRNDEIVLAIIDHIKMHQFLFARRTIEKQVSLNLVLIICLEGS